MSKTFGEIESHRLFYASSYYTIKTLGRILLGFQVYGQENVPKADPAIVAADHHDMLDIFLLPAAIPGRHISMVARQEIYDYPIIGTMFNRWDGIKFNRNMLERVAYKDIKNRLASGRLVGLFPGRTRTSGPGIGNFHPAVAGYAMYTGVPTIPAAISGVEDAFTLHHHRQARVDFGPAIDPPKNKKDQARYMAEFTDSVQSLSKRGGR